MHLDLPVPATGHARHLVPWVSAMVLALAASLGACRLASVCGIGSLAWDTGEYVIEGLDTVDRLEAASLTAWPGIVRHHQGYAKPPLLVNVLAGWLWLVGPTRLDAAIAGNALVTTLVLFAVALLWAGRAAGGHAALLAALAVGAMPILGRTAAEVFPEPLILALATAAVAVLLWPDRRWPLWRVALLGAVIGLGMLAKASFPALVTGPFLVWLAAGRTFDAPPAPRRIGILAAATAAGLALASIWYSTNWREAIDYVRSAHAFNLHPDWTRAQVLSQWVDSLVRETFGIAGVVLVLAALAALPLGRLDRRRLSALAMMSGGLPMLVIGLSSPNVASRLQLPAAGLLVIGAAMLVPSPAGTLRSRLVWSAVLVAVGLQWTAVQVAPVWRSFSPAGRIPFERACAKLDPYGRSRGRSCPDTRPAEAVVAAMGGLADQGLWPSCRLVTNHRELNVAALEVTAASRGLRVRFSWATYFTWDEAKRASVLDDLRHTPTVLVALFPGPRLGATDPTLNCHVDEVLDFVRTRSNGFSVWRRIAPEDGAFTLFLMRNFDPETLPPSRPLAAELGGMLQIRGFAADARGLLVDFWCLERTGHDLAVAIRGTPAATAEHASAPALVADDRLFPPTSAWRSHRRYRVRLPVKGFREDVPYTVRLTLFDPHRISGEWRTIPRTDPVGGTEVVLTDVVFARAGRDDSGPRTPQIPRPTPDPEQRTSYTPATNTGRSR